MPLTTNEELMDYWDELDSLVEQLRAMSLLLRDTQPSWLSSHMLPPYAQLMDDLLRRVHYVHQDIRPIVHRLQRRNKSMLSAQDFRQAEGGDHDTKSDTKGTTKDAGNTDNTGSNIVPWHDRTIDPEDE